MSDLKLEDLTVEKERLLTDRKALLERLDELTKTSEQIKNTSPSNWWSNPNL